MNSSQFQFETFVSKYLYDAEFKKRADADLEGTLESLGVEITAQVQAAIDAFTSESGALEIDRLAGALNNSFVGMN